MRRVHRIKIAEEFAGAVWSGDKTFELRENDRGYQTGDIIEFVVVDPNAYGREHPSHPLYEKTYEITYVLSGWGLKEGYVALAIKPFEEERDGV